MFKALLASNPCIKEQENKYQHFDLYHQDVADMGPVKLLGSFPGGTV